jgi:hypothetical protein
MSHVKSGVVWVAVLMITMSGAVAQSAKKVSAPSKTAPRDAGVEKAMKLVTAADVQRVDEKLVSFGTRLTLTSAMPVASGRGVAAAREWIRSEFERYSKECGGCLEVKLDTFTEGPVDRIPSPTELVNVYAIQRGTDSENAKRVYVVGGHYDSRPSDTLDTKADAPGANDDGSGTTVAIEAARVLSKSKFPATIVYVAFAGEEQGLNGSKHFAKMAKAEGWNIEGVLSNDIVGGDKSPGQNTNIVRVFSEGLPIGIPHEEWRRVRMLGAESDSSSRQLARYVNDVGMTYFPAGGFRPMMVFRQDRFLRGGDHTSFNEQGFSAVRVTEFHENYNHQHQTPRTENGIEYGDLPKFVDYDYLANVARLNIATLASLASAPAPPAQVRVLTKNLENDTTVTWQAAPGGLATGYEVVTRATTAPTWENVHPVAEGTKATLPMSKDNVFFGVRSVDGKGHRSPVVTPIPER